MAMIAEDIRAGLLDQFDTKMREMEREADRRVTQSVCTKKIDLSTAELLR